MICDDCQKQDGCPYLPDINNKQDLICGNFFPKEPAKTGNWFADGIINALRTANSQNAGIKHDTGKPPITLLDRDFLEGAAQVMRFGAEKYGRHNWCKGISHTRLADAAMRHLIAWASGEDIDPESGLPHIDHASASLNMLRGNQRLHPGMDDRYKGQDIPARRE